MRRAALGKFLYRSLFDIAGLGVIGVIASMHVAGAMTVAEVILAVAVVDRLMLLWRRHCRQDDTLDGVKQDVEQTRDLVLAMAEAAEADSAPDGPPDLRLVR